MNKQQLVREKIQVAEMTASLESLSQADKQELLRLRCRTDFITFARYITSEVPVAGAFKPFSVHRLIGGFLQNIGDGDKSYCQTAISLPPRTGKSLLISKIFPAWQIGRSPTAQFIMSSYALALTKENSRAILEYISNKQFSWIFPECAINIDKCNLETIRTGNGGLIKVASANGNVTGFGFGIIDDSELPGVGILDDLLASGNSAQIMETTYSWTQTQFLTRKLPNYAIISMGTRFHADDVIGRMLKADAAGWRELNVPALCVDEERDVLGRKLGESHWPELFPVDALQSTRRIIGEPEWNALYQGRPQGDQGAIFKEHWFSTHEKNKKAYDFIYATIDTAYQAKAESDYTAICIWGHHKHSGKLHLMHYVLERMEFPDLEKLITELAGAWKVRCFYIESRANGLPLIQTLRRTLNVSLRELKPTKDKVLRANSIAPFVEQGLVSIYENINNYPERMGELTSFPYIKKDDFVDAFVYGIIVYRDEVMGGGTIAHGGERTRFPTSRPSEAGGGRKSLKTIASGAASTSRRISAGQNNFTKFL